MHWLDDVFGWVTSRPRFFRDGFGDVDAAVAGFDRREFEAISIAWEGEERVASGVRVRHGRFESPCAAELPEESRSVRFQMLMPVGVEKPPVALHLAATGAEGFSQRRTIAIPLVQSGVGAIIAENPYYGSRRPRGQSGAAIRTVADQIRMNRAAIVESLATLKWLQKEGFSRLAVTGFSMGGVIAAMVGGLWDGPIAIVPCAGSVSMAPMWIRGVMRRRVPGALDEARFRAALEVVSAARVPAPRVPAATIVWGARADGFVPAENVSEFAGLWPGVEVRWAETGHVAGFLRHAEEWRVAVREAVGRLP